MTMRNMVLLDGYCADKAEVRYAPKTGRAVAQVRLATTERWKDDQGERKERTDWHNLSIWGKSGEALAKFVEKGTPLRVQGHLSTRSYEKDGQKHYRTDVVVEDWLLGPKRQGAAENGSDGGPSGRVPPEDMDDDLPL